MNIFYSPLTAYVPLIFKIFNFTFTNCLKIFMFAVTLLSGITMYTFMMNVTKIKMFHCYHQFYMYLHHTG